MTWVRIDDGICDHPKILAAASQIGANGVLIVLGMMTFSISYCAKYLTDGALPFTVITSCRRIKNARKIAAAMTASGLWEETESGWQIHDYHHFQPTAREVKERRARDLERKHRVDSARIPRGSRARGYIPSHPVVPE